LKLKLYNKKNKFISIICSFLLLAGLAFTSIPVSAAVVTPTVSYTVTGNTTVGSTISIAVNVSNVTGLYGAGVDFKYDPTLIKVNSISKGSLFTKVDKPASATINNGIGSIGMSLQGSATTIAGSGTIAIINATVLKEGTISINTNSDVSKLVVGGYTCSVKLADSLSNKIAYTFTNKNIVTTNYKSYEDTSSYIKYIGDSWTSSKSTIFSGGAINYASKAGSYLEFKFTGTAFKWVGTKAASRGISRINIDNGAYVANIDAYNPTTQTQQTLYENKALANKEHTVRIAMTGTKNPKASLYFIDLDRFDIVGTAVAPAPTSYEDSSPFIKYIGTSWTSASSSTFSGGAIKYASKAGSYIEFKFTGTSFKWIGTKAGSRGIARINVDNGAYVANIDAYSPTTLPQQVLYQNTALADKEHTVRIAMTGTKNPKASLYFIDVDRLVITGTAIS